MATALAALGREIPDGVVRGVDGRVEVAELSRWSGQFGTMSLGG